MVVLILTSVLGTLWASAYNVGETPNTQTGYADLHEFQRVRWNEIINATFGDTAREIPETYDFTVANNQNDTFAPTRTEIINNTLQVQKGNKYFNWKNSAEYEADDTAYKYKFMSNLALGKDIETNVTTHDTYYTDLTDGTLRSDFGWAANQWAGFAIENNIEGNTAQYTIDLGTVETISNAAVHCYYESVSGIGYPEGFSVEISTNGATFTEVAEFDISTLTDETAQHTYWLSVDFDEKSARYVRFNFTEEDGWVFLDELEVYGKGYTEWDGTYYTGTERTERIKKAESNIETVHYDEQSVEGGNDNTYYVKEQDIEYVVFDVYNVKDLELGMATAREKSYNVKVNLLTDIDMNGSEHVWETQNYDDIESPTDGTYSGSFTRTSNTGGGTQTVSVTQLQSNVAFRNLSGSTYGTRIYIEGNGYTIYNMKTTGDEVYDCATAWPYGSMYRDTISAGSSGFVGKVQTKYLTMKNLDFERCMAFSRSSGVAIAVAYVGNRTYLENVNVKNSFVYGTWAYAATLMGQNYSTNGNVFVRNCSSENCVVYGSFHSGGLTGCQNNCGQTYYTHYDVDFPAEPDAWLTDQNRYYVDSSGTSHTIAEDKTNTYNTTSYYSSMEGTRVDHTYRIQLQESNVAIYPEIIENCYSANCEIFSIDKTGDSGAFISCGGKFIARNCFTNNAIYGNIRTGAFIGRIVTRQSLSQGLYDDAGSDMVETYFENCFSSGTVEGKEEIGGFTGYEENGTIDTDGGETYWDGGAALRGRGVTIYKNCYSTAMVGMDYAGSYLGGFVGREQTASDQTATVIVGYDEDGNAVYNENAGSVYINCYAAGEVGNILTDTEVLPETPSSYDYLGGFIGAANLSGGTLMNNGNFINCYYDKQTTAMHERAVGAYNNYIQRYSNEDVSNGEYYSQVPGVTGVYTQTSVAKTNKLKDENPSKVPTVQGLADTTGIMQDDIWTYNSKETYPELGCFSEEDQSKKLFLDAHYASDATSATKSKIDKRLEAKRKTVKQYSLASVSTVLLDHWDHTMNMDTGSLGQENDWVTGLATNEMTVMDYTDSDVFMPYWEVVGGETVEDGEDRHDIPNGKYWSKTYTNLVAGSYEFVVQEGDSWAYNYGSTGYNSDNCVLNLGQDCDVVIKWDYFHHVTQTATTVPYYIWAEFYDSDTGSYLGYEILGENVNASVDSTWVLAGSFGEENGLYWWKAETTLSDGTENPYLLTSIGDGYYQTTHVVEQDDLQSGLLTLEFKIADGSWSDNYGLGGENNGQNMSVVVQKPCTLVFTFDEETKLTSVTSTTTDAIKSKNVEYEAIDFTGYSLVSYSEITGYEGLTGLEAAQAGAMSLNDDGLYEVTFNVNKYSGNYLVWGKNYGYKVVENAVDSGQYAYFKLNDISSNHPDLNSVPITFTYDPSTGETTVECKKYPEAISEVSFDTWGVIGTVELTGYDWEKDASTGTSLSASNRSSTLMTETDGVYVWRAYDVPAGAHAFKVVANHTWDSGVDYGANDGSGNYTFTLIENADELYITFDPDEQYVTVTANPSGAIYRQQYVVVGTTALTGYDWAVNGGSKGENIMEYDEKTGLYVKRYENIACNSDDIYVFKVIKYGRDNNMGTNTFQVNDGNLLVNYRYDLEITYDPSTRKTEYHLYNQNGELKDQYMVPQEITSYVVAGDKSLTGYDWLENDDAVAAGTMTLNEDGLYEIFYEDVIVNQGSNNYSFKIYANGTEDSGISYGSSYGQPYIFTLATLEGETTGKADVKITFNEDLQLIKVTITTPHYESNINEDEFTWYICGDYTLVSADSYVADYTVYDTVRDITSDFDFTYSVCTDWYYDESSNSISRFYSQIENFDLGYNVDGTDVTGTFAEKVVNLKVDYSSTYPQYYCDSFAPGKQWVKVITTNRQNSAYVGYRRLRIIPTIYLEAGTDAYVSVIQSGSDRENLNIENVVTYDKDSATSNVDANGNPYVTYDGLNVGDTDDQKIFSYYNFALTAAYLTTDVSGLGYYGNYGQYAAQDNYPAQDSAKIIEFSDDSDIQRYNKAREEYVMDRDRYFAMSSVFNESASYTDAGNSGADTNLQIDTLVDQALIGNSYLKSASDTRDTAKTIVKISRINDNGTKSKVFMNTENVASSDYTNYLKWTGQEKFDETDIGTYEVAIYWSLTDGRYRVDTKEVVIDATAADIKKKVDVNYIEGVGTEDDNNSNREITYTLTYNSAVQGDFTISDIVPYVGDLRYDEDKLSLSNQSVIGNEDTYSLTLKNVTVTGYDADDGDATVSDLQAYYTTDTSVRDYFGKPEYRTVTVKDTEITQLQPNEKVADATREALLDGSDGWTKVSGDTDVSNVVGIAVTGHHSGSGEIEVKVEYTVSVNNADADDLYVNNSFYTIYDSSEQDEKLVSGYSNVVSTAAVGRGISGYAWFDIDADGFYDKAVIPGANDGLSSTAKTRKYYFYPQHTSWLSDGAYYAAYVWSSYDSSLTDFIRLDDTDDNGIYECNVAYQYNNIIFCKMKAGTNTINWSNVAEQTVDLSIDTNLTDQHNYFALTTSASENNGKATGSWKTVTDGSANYSLMGIINGKSYYNGLPFDDNRKLTLEGLTADSYVYVRNNITGDFYYAQEFDVESTKATLYKNSDTAQEAVYIPASSDDKKTYTITILENGDGTLTLSYSEGKQEEADQAEAVVEPPLQGLKVQLLVYDKTTKSYNVVEETVTDENGFYEFSNIYRDEGLDFRILFTEPDNPDTTLCTQPITTTRSDGTIEQTDVAIKYADLHLSHVPVQFQYYYDFDAGETVGSLVGAYGSLNRASKDTSTFGGDSVYYIDAELPSGAAIYRNEGNNAYMGGEVEGYYYNKYFQNIALTNVNAADMTIVKKNQKGELLEGVEFMLEYREDEDSEYVELELTYVPETGSYWYGIVDDAYETFTRFTTNANGEISFTELPLGDYRLTETKPLDGYNLLSSTLDFSLPYDIDTTRPVEDGLTIGNCSNVTEGVLYNNRSLSLCYDITYTISNAKVPFMPLTGLEPEDNSYVYLAAILTFAFALMLSAGYMIYLKRRKKAKHILKH